MRPEMNPALEERLAIPAAELERTRSEVSIRAARREMRRRNWLPKPATVELRWDD